MSLLDGVLGEVTGPATVEHFAAKVGLSPEQVALAISALGQAHVQEGDAVQTAAATTGLPTGVLLQIVGHIGGEGSLGQFTWLLKQDGERGGPIGGLSKLF